MRMAAAKHGVTKSRLSRGRIPMPWWGSGGAGGVVQSSTQTERFLKALAVTFYIKPTKCPRGGKQGKDRIGT